VPEARLLMYWIWEQLAGSVPLCGQHEISMVFITMFIHRPPGHGKP
jgi:hypothetical protein